MIDDDITQASVNASEEKVMKANNPDEIYTKEEKFDEPKRKTNPAKYIALIAGCLIILLLCCCCSSLIFLPAGFSDESIDDLCAVLESEGQKDPFGICNENGNNN
ncbi:hypothetical protein KBD45_03585 [Candidatus Dojkabacteria bacterium]|nr:hypothetical protein [Candidatus Dojkabacteria bacterium]